MGAIGRIRRGASPVTVRLSCSLSHAHTHTWAAATYSQLNSPPQLVSSSIVVRLTRTNCNSVTLAVWRVAELAKSKERKSSPAASTVFYVSGSRSRYVGSGGTLCKEQSCGGGAVTRRRSCGPEKYGVHGCPMYTCATGSKADSSCRTSTALRRRRLADVR